MLVYHSISWMKWPVITTYAGGGMMVASVTAILSRFKAEWATQLQPEAIIGACEEVGYTSWRDRVLTPVTTIQLFLLQILHGNTACTHLPHLSGIRFSASAYCQARTKLPLDPLACRFGVIKAALDNLCGLTSWARDAVWPTQIADGLITLHIIDQLRDIDLQGRTPVMGLEHRMVPLYTILTSTTLESNKSVDRRGNLPKESIGFWIPSNDLCRMDQEGKTRYKCAGRGRDIWITYVGFETPVDVLPHGTLLRVSLARWWQPEDASDWEERCYLQLSGWFEVTPRHVREALEGAPRV